jgi:hypothetical protein
MMKKAFATFRNGQVELDHAASWPEGTRLEVGPAAKKLGLDETEWPETPQEKAEWLEWFTSLEPLDMTPAELTAFEAELSRSKKIQKELLRKSWRQEEAS